MAIQDVYPVYRLTVASGKAAITFKVLKVAGSGGKSTKVRSRKPSARFDTEVKWP